MSPRPAHFGPTRKMLERNEKLKSNPQPSRNTAFVEYYPLEDEAVRAMGLVRKMGKRLSYESNQIARKEKLAGLEYGSMGLFSKEWCEQLKSYWTTLEGLLREHRKYKEMKMDMHGLGIDLTPEDESRELVVAASQLTEEEFRAVVAIRAGMPPNGKFALTEEEKR